MHPAEAVALGFRYPTPGAAATLAAAIDAAFPRGGAVERHLRAFVAEVAALDLGSWEELHTATLDLSPRFVPYVGHLAFGESYRRGAFMADLVGALREAGVDTAGELPDHVEPILRYLAVVDEPMADLVEVLPGALATMHRTLVATAPDDPYRHLLAAAVALSADLRPLTIGRRQ